MSYLSFRQSNIITQAGKRPIVPFTTIIVVHPKRSAPTLKASVIVAVSCCMNKYSEKNSACRLLPANCWTAIAIDRDTKSQGVLLRFLLGIERWPQLQSAVVTWPTEDTVGGTMVEQYPRNVICRAKESKEEASPWTNAAKKIETPAVRGPIFHQSTRRWMVTAVLVLIFAVSLNCQ